MSKPILLLDFDGVCHSYTSGWQGVDVIPDPHVPGLFEFLEQATEHFDIQIYSSRSKDTEGLNAMAVWFITERKKWREQGGRSPVGAHLNFKFPTEKPAAFLTIDDRCICFNGAWPNPEQMLQFKPWNKK
jgi:hypothetical protein